MDEQELDLMSINDTLLRTEDESHEEWEWDIELRRYIRVDRGDEL